MMLELEENTNTRVFNAKYTFNSLTKQIKADSSMRLGRFFN